MYPTPLRELVLTAQIHDTPGEEEVIMSRKFGDETYVPLNYRIRSCVTC